jgi:hypothetical protein
MTFWRVRMATFRPATRNYQQLLYQQFVVSLLGGAKKRDKS